MNEIYAESPAAKIDAARPERTNENENERKRQQSENGGIGAVSRIGIRVGELVGRKYGASVNRSIAST